MYKLPFALILAITALAACVPDEQMQQNPSNACSADSFQGLIGQPQAVAAAMTLPADARIIGPNQPVTSDFRQERLNIEYGADGRITKVSCY